MHFLATAHFKAFYFCTRTRSRRNVLSKLADNYTPLKRFTFLPHRTTHPITDGISAVVQPDQGQCGLRLCNISLSQIPANQRSHQWTEPLRCNRSAHSVYRCRFVNKNLQQRLNVIEIFRNVFSPLWCFWMVDGDQICTLIGFIFPNIHKIKFLTEKFIVMVTLKLFELQRHLHSFTVHLTSQFTF